VKSTMYKDIKVMGNLQHQIWTGSDFPFYSQFYSLYSYLCFLPPFIFSPTISPSFFIHGLCLYLIHFFCQLLIRHQSQLLFVWMFDIGVDSCCFHDCFDCSCSCFGMGCIDSNNNSVVSSKADGGRSLIIVVFFVILTRILLIFLCISMGLFILISMLVRLLLISIVLRIQLRKSHFEIRSQQLPNFI